jgi:hypothetical protein
MSASLTVRTRRVVKLLTEIPNGTVWWKGPKPLVLFKNFRRARWISNCASGGCVKANAELVSSELRQMIAGTFEELSCHAFPQRDLHLDTTQPLQVQVLPASDRPPQASEAAKQAAPAAKAPGAKTESVVQPKDTTQPVKLP